MSSTYNVVSGDTFSLIASKTGSSAKRIESANPGVSEPLVPGEVLAIPDDPPRENAQRSEAAREDEVAVLIEGKRFRFWDKVSVTLGFDSVDTVTFTAPFDPGSPDFRDLFRPFTYKQVDVTVGEETLFTGTVVDVIPSMTGSGNAVAVKCYSLPGVLGDCQVPASAVPLQFNGAGLAEITTSLLDPFGLSSEFSANAEEGDIFKKVNCAPDRVALDFLVDLAKQRGLVITSSAAGALLYDAADLDSKPVAKLTQGAPILEITPVFKPQDYYSSVTGIVPVLVGTEVQKLLGVATTKKRQITVRNPRLSGVIRPHTFAAESAIEVNSKAARFFAQSASYTVKVGTWRDPQGALWRPNTKVTINAPQAMVYSDYDFLVRTVTLAEDYTSTLNVTIPEAFTSEQPTRLPWDD